MLSLKRSNSLHWSFLFSIMLLSFFHTGFVHAGGLNERFLQIQDEISKDPDNPELKMDLAYLYSQGLEFQRAVSIYEDVVKVDKSNQRAWIELCALKTQMQDEKGAIEACEMLVQMADKEAWRHDNLGLMYFKLGQFEKSLRPFLDAISLDREAHLSVLHFAQSLMALKQYEPARDILEHTLTGATLTPADQELFYHGLYIVYQKLNDNEKAYQSIYKTWKLSGSSIYFGKVVSAWIKYHELVTFIILSFFCLWMSQYFGQRINRFLKNEV